MARAKGELKPWRRKKYEVKHMLRWILMFFIIAVIGAFLGFTGLAGTTVSIAKILLFIFLILFLISCVGQLQRPR